MSDWFPAGLTVYRDRRADAGPSGYNPDRQRKGDWDEQLTKELAGVYLDLPSGTAPGSATRSQTLSERVLYVPEWEPGDIVTGDRIRVGGTFEVPGQVWFVNVPPAEIEANPFTGWRPPLEVALEMTEG